MKQVNFYSNNIKHWPKKKNLFILGKEMLKRNILNHQILETNHKELPHIIPTLLNFSG